MSDRKVISQRSDELFVEEVRRGNKLQLAIWKEGTATYQDSITRDGTTLRPQSGGMADALKLYSSIGEAMDIEVLAERIKDFIQRYVTVSPGFLTIMTRFAMMTHVSERFPTIPYLRMRGEPGTGKSRFLDVMSAICRRAFVTSNITSAALFRFTDR